MMVVWVRVEKNQQKLIKISIFKIWYFEFHCRLFLVILIFFNKNNGIDISVIIDHSKIFGHLVLHLTE